MTPADGRGRPASVRSPVPATGVLIVGNYVPSLSVARGLAERGYRVVAGDGGEYSPVRWSRACRETWRHPPIREPDAFLDALRSFLGARPDISIVLPLQPRYVALLAARRDELAAGVTVASPASEVVATCLDKAATYALASEMGVPFRPPVRVDTPDELAAAVDAVGYPCIIRPLSDSGDGFGGARKAMIWRDRTELTARDRIRRRAYPLVAQRYVEGDRHNVFFSAHRGRLLGSLETRIRRTDRSDGTGRALEGITVVDENDLPRHVASLVAGLDYTGVGFAQFVVPATGEPHFLELNPRHAGSNAIAERCGLALAVAAIELAAAANDAEPPRGLDGPVGPGCRAGTTYAWSSRSIAAITGAIVDRQIGPSQAVTWAMASLRSAIDADQHLTWSWRDPLPTLRVYAHLLTLGPWRRRRSSP